MKRDYGPKPSIPIDQLPTLKGRPLSLSLTRSPAIEHHGNPCCFPGGEGDVDELVVNGVDDQSLLHAYDSLHRRHVFPARSLLFPNPSLLLTTPVTLSLSCSLSISVSLNSLNCAVLGLRSQSSIEEVKEAYDNVSSTWNSEAQAPDSLEFIKDVIEKLKKQYAGESFSCIDLPLLESAAYDHNLPVITSKDFQTMFQDNKPWLIQLWSFGSKSCDQFSHAWKRIAGFLDGVANAAQVDLEVIQLATYLAD
ncbi:uncharacterized protein LOC133745059 [Rosa rugosa]|uniref:uncharacterized protein LOC133745059 n=1 Tax=Rosa rugosa TaxID=74645 RepID=UPI002B401450|nr:uncharacterized protein LOC133745059 [Rosa rugosa]